MMTRTVQIIGDGMRGRWITWRWSTPEPDATTSAPAWPVGVAETMGLEAATRRLAAALPPAGPDPHVGPARRTTRFAEALEACLTQGDLVVPQAEHALMDQLSRSLLPAALRQQLQDCAHSGDRLIVKVAPSPLAAAVPWGLLVLDDDRRLLDVAEVSWLAPTLLRDVGKAKTPRSWAETKQRPPLHVIDPHVISGDQVLGSSSDAAWITGVPGTGFRDDVTSDSLSVALGEGPSRFYFLGHCSANRSPRGPRSDRMGLVLSDVRGGSQHPLTARTLLAEPDRWPMPPRAAVVACASGADMADFEPFGLAAALLNNGASLVQATLWTLPTGHALTSLGGATTNPFLTLAKAIEAAQRSDDPVAHLHAWQRRQLTAWKEAERKDEPPINVSPILWGAAMTMIAPPRRLDDESAD